LNVNDRHSSALSPGIETGLLFDAELTTSVCWIISLSRGKLGGMLPEIISVDGRTLRH
jgi:hypothetical protein